MRSFSKAADKAAIFLSAVCAIHCLVLPIILILVPPISGLMSFSDEAFHQWLLFAVMPISVFAVISGFSAHRNKQVAMIGVVGMLFLIGAVLLGHDLLGEHAEVVLTVIGSALIAFSHYKNLTLRAHTH